MRSWACEIYLNLFPLMASSHIIIPSFFSKALDLSIPAEFLHNLSHFKFDGKGTTTILDYVIEFVQFCFSSCIYFEGIIARLFTLTWMFMLSNGVILYPLLLSHILSNWLMRFFVFSKSMNIKMSLMKLINL